MGSKYSTPSSFLKQQYPAMATTLYKLRRSACHTGVRCNLFFDGAPVLKSSMVSNLNFTDRWYRGESGDTKTRVEANSGNMDVISEREAELLKIAEPKYQAIYKRHIMLPKVDGLSSMTLYGKEDAATSSDSREEEELQIRRKRLIYRSKQRGWLEVDLLLGMWSDKFVPSMTVEELDEFERFVNLETIDIYNVLTLRSNLDHFEDESLSGVVSRLQEWAKSSPLGKAEPHAYAAAKRTHKLT